MRELRMLLEDFTNTLVQVEPGAHMTIDAVLFMAAKSMVVL